jgi:hypothetical protein
MSDLRVLDQLDQYGTWLEQRSGTQLTPTAMAEPKAELSSDTASGPTIQLGQTVDLRPVRGRLWLGAAAAVAVLAIGFAALRPTDSPTSEGVTAGSLVPDDAIIVNPIVPDSGEPVFVLPPADDGYELVNGSISAVTGLDQRESRLTTLIGWVEGELYTKLISISVTEAAPTPSDQWTPVETAAGPALHNIMGPISNIAFEWDDVWIVLSGAVDESDLTLVQMREISAVNSDGTIVLNADSGYEIVEQPELPAGFSGVSTYYEARRGANGPYLIIETATGVGNFPAVASSFGGELSRIQVQGRPGWRLDTRGVADEPDSYVVVWQLSPTEMVAVFGGTTFAQVLSLAESLIVVDQQTWKDALRNYEESSIDLSDPPVHEPQPGEPG